MWHGHVAWRFLVGVILFRKRVPPLITGFFCAAYQFETEFTLTISGAGNWKQLYGQRASPKLWAFGWSKKNRTSRAAG